MCASAQHSPPKINMRVDVVTSGESKPLYFDVPDSTQICELLCRIGMSRCIPSWRLRVVHSDRVLSRDATLAQSQLRDGDLLTLVVKPASSFVLLGTAGGSVELWDIDDCNMIRTFVGHVSHLSQKKCHAVRNFLLENDYDFVLLVNHCDR